MTRCSAFAPVIALVALSCGPKDEPAPAPAAAPADAASSEIAAGVLSAMDLGADPCNDFYQYACGGWLERTELPADKPRWSRSFSAIDESNKDWTKELLDNAAADPTAGDADWEKLGLAYGACMDTDAVEAAGIAPLTPLLGAIDGLERPDQLAGVLAQLHVANVDALFGFWVEGDFKDPLNNIFYLSQSGLGLPDRDYYIKDDEKSVATQTAYKAHVARMLVFAGAAPEAAAADAENIYAFEDAIARFSSPREDLRDPVTTYNRVERAGLAELAPNLDWDAYFAAMDAADIAPISVDVPAWYTSLDALLQDTELPTVQAYLRWQLISSLAYHLTDEILTAQHDFFGKQLYGQQELEPRWKRCVRTTEGALGEAIGKFYVSERFGGDNQATAEQMVADIFASYEAQLPNLDWMDDETRAAALVKMQQVTEQIGQPKAWRDYSAMALSADSHAGNILAIRAFENARELAKVGNPVDPDEWYMGPSQVNAYYHPLRNQIVFPAGILQPPFFSADYPTAMNYGAIGMVIGHELSHGFDDSGRKFDGTGKMTDWWNEGAVMAYEERAQCVADQYGAIEVQDGMYINGQLTLGENIADLGGLKQSYRAWKLSEARTGQSAQLVNELSNDQLFFVAFAQGWCSVTSPQFEQMLLSVDSHSPPKARVNQPVQNFDAFHQAFACEEGAAMRPEKTCEIW